MQLIGMLDSPYVRRVAISLQLLGIPFEHRSISVFDGYAEFQMINPVVRAPSLLCDDGEVLMDSTLILEYAEAVANPGKSLMPSDISERQHALCVIGLALAACDKSVTIIYERDRRSAAKFHEPWMVRVMDQLLAAYGMLESKLLHRPLAAGGAIDQAGVSVAVAWNFTQATSPEYVNAPDYPVLSEYSRNAERLPSFRAAPHGSSTCGLVEPRLRKELGRAAEGQSR